MTTLKNKYDFPIGDKNLPMIPQFLEYRGRGSFEHADVNTFDTLRRYIKEAVQRNVNAANTIVDVNRIVVKRGSNSLGTSDQIMIINNLTEARWASICDSTCAALSNRLGSRNVMEFKLDKGNLYVCDYSNYVCTLFIPKVPVLHTYYSRGMIGPLYAKIAESLGFILTESGLYMMDDGQPLMVTESNDYISIILGGNLNMTISYAGNSIDNYNQITSGMFFNPTLFENFQVEDDYLKILGVTHAELQANIKVRLRHVTQYVPPEDMKGLNHLRSRATEVYTRVKAAMEKPVFGSNKDVEAKFNADTVKTLTGAEGTWAGELIKGFKISFKSTENYEMFIRSSMQSTINAKFLEYYVDRFGPVVITAEPIPEPAVETTAQVEVPELTVDIPAVLAEITPEKPKAKRKSAKKKVAEESAAEASIDP